MILFCLIQWNKLDTSICQAPSYSVFRNALLDFMQPTANSTFGSNVSGLKLLTRLRVGFSHLRQHKFKHNFQGKLNRLFLCSLVAEDYHLFMCCQHFSNQQNALFAQNVLFDDLNSINSEILKMTENVIVQVLLTLGLLHPQFVSLKAVRGLMNHFLFERNLFYIF